MTNLLIATAQYTVDATSISSSKTVDANNPVENLITGPRGTYTQCASAETSWGITFNLPSSTSVTVDYYIVARANILKAAGSTRLKLQGYNGSYTNLAGTDVGLQSLTLYGPRSEDAIFTSDLGNSDYTMPASGTYTALAHNPVSFADPANKYKHSKFYCGAWFDPGRDPERPHVSTKVINHRGERESRYVFTFTWRGITNAKRNEFFSKLFDERQKPVFLYTKTYHEILFNHRCLHCTVAGYETSYVAPDCHDITITFEEQI